MSRAILSIIVGGLVGMMILVVIPHLPLVIAAVSTLVVMVILIFGAYIGFLHATCLLQGQIKRRG